MKRFLLFVPFIVLILWATGDIPALAQNEHFAKPGMGAGKFNYQTFTSVVRDTSAEMTAANRGYENDPELGLSFKESPCRDCYEAIGRRTEISKTYIRKNKNGKEMLKQTASGPMHYKDETGRWKTIKSSLQPETHGSHLFSAPEQPTPVTVNTVNGYTSLGKNGTDIRFNNELELIYEGPDGTLQNLGSANWHHFTAGDDGVYVVNAWPGIDIEMHTTRGAIKTSFWINHSLPAYANGSLLISDHFNMPEGLSIQTPDNRGNFTGLFNIVNKQGRNVYTISEATAFELNNGQPTLRNLEYRLSDQKVCIVISGDFLNRPVTSYPVIIDPLVTDSTSVSAPGSTYSAGWTVGCATVNPASVPQDLTITDIQFSFDFVTSGGALLTNGAIDFYLGSCRNPARTGYYWYCATATTGACGGYDISLYSDFASCVPAERCDSFDLDITMNMYQNYAYATPCSTAYISADQPYTITVVGQTLTADPVAVPGGSTVCAGTPVTMNDTAFYGKPPYTYSWNPGGLSGPTVTVTPSATTTYTLVVTDSCGFKDTVTQTITVNPNPAITGIATFCLGSSGTMHSAVSGGTWTSSTTSVATINASSGAISAIGIGTTNITYTTPSGCIAFTTVTVVAAPSTIGGTLTVCTGNTTTLTNSVGGGTWSSSNTSVATVNSSTGVVYGISPGSTMITYSISSACEVAVSVNVYPSPVITDTSSHSPTTCTSNDGNITLYGLSPGTAYSVSYYLGGTLITTYIIANGSGHVIISGLGAGVFTNITVTAGATGCPSNTVAGPIVLNYPDPPATPTATNSSPVCAGESVSFTATCSTPGVSYQWSGPGGFTSTLQNPTIAITTMASAGIYTVTTILLGCVSSPNATVVTINPVPFVNNIKGTNPSTCFGTDGMVTLSGLIAGASYTVNYTFNGTPVTATIMADASGNVVVTGSSGVYDHFVLSSLGCISSEAGPITLKDPGAPPAPKVWSNSPVCAGDTLALFASDSIAVSSWLWTGPNGFIANIENPILANVQASAAGTYVVTAANGNCKTSGTTNVVIYPGITLTDVTQNQTITFGASVQLNAWGAELYMWTPDDGSLSDPNINNPVATPHANTTYIVSGMNQWGCKDTAMVTIDVIIGDTILVPTAFTPNGDGLNDIFKIVHPGNRKLTEFSVFNRWGQMIYHNEWNINQGWDGKFNGVPQDIGTYNYIIILALPDGTSTVYKGDVLLVR